MVAAGGGRLVHAEPHRLRPPRLCDRRRSRCGAPRRHQHRPHAGRGLCASPASICAIAAWVLIGRIGGVSPQAGQTANLDSITAVVIGGTSLFGGRGSIIGTLFGALIVGVFRNGLALSGLDVLWQDFTVGVLIIVAVTLDQWIRKVVGMSATDSRAGSRGARPGQALRSRRGARPCRFRSPAERDPRRHRRQRRRQVDADQGAHRRGHPRCGPGADGRQAGQFPLADRGAQRRHRDRLSEPRAFAGTVDRRQPVPRARAPQERPARARLPAARSLLHAARGAQAPERARPDDHPEHRPGGRDAVRRPAARRRGRARGGFRLEASSSWTSRRQRSASRNRAGCWS